jgi:hypothetical protein
MKRDNSGNRNPDDPMWQSFEYVFEAVKQPPEVGTERVNEPITKEVASVEIETDAAQEILHNVCAEIEEAMRETSVEEVILDVETFRDIEAFCRFFYGQSFYEYTGFEPIVVPVEEELVEPVRDPMDVVWDYIKENEDDD